MDFDARTGSGRTSVAEHAIPALKASFCPLERNQDLVSWDPV